MTTHTYETGGGVVVDDEGRVLLIERHVEREEGTRHEIRLPKGHIDPGESAEEAALREVREETGYSDLDVAAALGVNTVEYRHRNEPYRRTEHYFLMRLLSDKNEGPQFSDEEEARFTCRWAADWDEAERLLTYDSERLMIRRARRL